MNHALDAVMRSVRTSFEPLTIRGTEVLPDQTAIQMARLRPIGSSLNNLIEIPEHTLCQALSLKNPEAEVKPSYEVR